MNTRICTLFWICSLAALGMMSCQPETEILAIAPLPPYQSAITVLKDQFQGRSILLAGSERKNILIAFEPQLEDGSQPVFRGSQLPLPALLEDQEGNVWDLFGEAIAGPRTGQRLKMLNGYFGYWFAFGSFFPGAEIYQGSPLTQTLPRTALQDPNWLIPRQHVYIGCSRDGIPVLETPLIEPYTEKDYLETPFYLSDDDLVVGIKVGNTYRAYSHSVLNWHEIINDTIGGQAIALIYCPLTGTAMAWNRTINGQTTTFGISGLLYNNNVMPYDRATGSIWSQMEEGSVFGPLKGTKAESIPVIETSWGTWRSMFKETGILSDQTGTERDYSDSPYGNYHANHGFVAFPILFDDLRLPRKERVLGIVIDGKAKVYQLENF